MGLILYNEGEFYILQPVAIAGFYQERRNVGNSCKIGIFQEPVRDVHLIELYQAGDYDVAHKTLDLVMPGENIQERIYDVAKSYGEEYAVKLGCSLLDETFRTKQSKLEEQAQEEAI